ncbi:MAG: hypothetical protein AAF383_17180, partial [Cyanobacteria bacterium P01_A01_bin.83]
TVIIHDKGLARMYASIHRSNLAKKQHQIWSKRRRRRALAQIVVRRLAVFSKSRTTGGFLNRALKRQELGGRVYEDEYDLAIAIVNGIENRGQQGNYNVERLLFN